MSDQDKRAVEGLARCGIDFEGLCDSFPQFSRKDIEAVFVRIRNSIGDGVSRCRRSRQAANRKLVWTEILSNRISGRIWWMKGGRAIGGVNKDE